MCPAIDPSNEFSQLYEESQRIWRHPSVARLRALLTVDLPPSMDQLFQMTANRYNNKGSDTPFDVVRARDGDDKARYMCGLLLDGVQEGVRSTAYHLRRYQSLTEEVAQTASGLIDEPPPRNPTSLGLPSQALVSEYEAFTVMSRATLDRLCRFFTIYFQESAKHLYTLRRSLEHNKANDAGAKRLVEAIARHEEYLDTQITREGPRWKADRDRLVHYEYIPWVTINIVRMPDRSLKVLGRVPGPDGRLTETAVDTLVGQFDALCACVADLVSSFLISHS